MMKNSPDILKITYRFIIIIILFGIFNVVYTTFFFEKDIQEYSSLINRVRAVPNNAEMIYLGESSNLSFRIDDKDKRKISEFISDFFPDIKSYDITKEAAHAGIYYTLLENISPENSAKTIIVTLNLRSFNAQWIFSGLETPLQKSIVLLKKYPPIFNRFLLSFKGYDIKTKKEREQQFKKMWKHDDFNFPYPFEIEDTYEWDKKMCLEGITDKNGNKDYKQTELACHYIKAYAFQIDTNNNPRIHDFNNIIELAKSREWNLVFNLLAENTEKAEQLVGKDLTFLMNQNAELLIDYYTRKGVIVVNNLNAVEDSQFMDQNWTTEHYAEKGRWTIASNVANRLKEIYPNQYKFINKNYSQASISFSKDMIKLKIQTIKSDSIWFSDIRRKAKENGLSIDSTLVLDAIWGLKEDQKQPIQAKDHRIKNIILKIKNDPNWYKAVKTKALKNNISIEKQLELDAIWMIENK